MQITVVFDGMEEFRQYMGGSSAPAVAAEKAAPAPKKADPAPVPAPAAPDPAPAPAPAPKKITMKEVTEKAIALMDAGRQSDLQMLLAKYGVQGLPALPADKLDQFYAELEVL